MDLDFNSLHWPHPYSVALAELFMVVYGLWCLITIIRRRSERPAFLALVPLSVTVPVVWLNYASLMQMMAIAMRGHRLMLAGGLAQTMVLLGTGAGVTAALAIAALLRGPRQGTSRAASVVAAAVIAVLAGVTIWFASYTMSGGVLRAPNMQIPLAGSIATAIVIVAYLVVAWRRKLYPSAIAVAAAALLVAIVARLQFEMYWRMAT